MARLLALIYGAVSYLIFFKYQNLEFRTRGFYRFVRHSLMTGFIIAFWATPNMTAGHLVFTIATTAYILTAIQIEERDLKSIHGEAYEDYQCKVSMEIPIPPGK
jgi:methanethiol S-methyltransferase